MSVMEPYSFQNIYLISTYRCNLNCEFCLFKYNVETEASIDKIRDQLEYAIQQSKKPVYLKITGGEPFIRPKLLWHSMKVCRAYKDKIYKIGIGTNGTLKFPHWFNEWDAIPTSIFLSRHSYLDNNPSLYDLQKDTTEQMNPDIFKFRINCNLIKGQIDSLYKMKLHMMYHWGKSGIDHFTFRELNNISLDDNSMYSKEVYSYENYYKNNLIPVFAIEAAIKHDSDFELSRVTGNYYDTNRWYWWNVPGTNKKISVKFRIIDEQKLVQYNKENEGVDEYVIHPDGNLTGCWDKDMKVIRK